MNIPPVGSTRPFRRCSTLFYFVLLAASLITWQPAFAVEGPVKAEDLLSSDPADLKKISFDDLAKIEVVSVSRRLESLLAAPSSISVVSGDEIRRYGYLNLPDALRLAPNLQVAQIDARQYAISSRGFNSSTANKLLVLIDGRTVYTPLYSGVFWDVQDTLLEDIDRIEVISGPGATLWGANAVNGVINILTKPASQTQGLFATAAAGNIVQEFGAIRYGGELAPDVHYRVYGKYLKHESAVFHSGIESGNEWRRGEGGFRIDWEPKSKEHVATFQGDLYGGNFSQKAMDDINVAGGNLLARYTRTFSEISELRIQAFFDETRRDIPNLFGQQLETYDLDVQHRFQFGERQTIVWGGGYRLLHDHVKNSKVLAFLPEKLNDQVFSAFVQDEIELVDEKLFLTLGSKFEHNDYSGFEAQPSARLSYLITTNQAVWGAVSRAVRTPSRIDRDFYVPGTPPYTVLQGGPDIVSEELLSYELGYRIQPFDSLSFSFAAFYNDYDYIRSAERINPATAFPIVLGNGSTGETYGFEVNLQYRIVPSWKMTLGYTRLEVNLGSKPGSTDRNHSAGESHDPNDQLFLRSSIDLGRHFEFDTGARYISSIVNQSVPGYIELETRLAWLPTKNLEIALIGQNLLHDRHPEFGIPLTRSEIQRSVYGKVTWRF